MLATAIGMIIEDVHDTAVTVTIGGQTESGAEMLLVGEDVVKLAAAILVLRRRAEPRPADV